MLTNCDIHKDIVHNLVALSELLSDLLGAVVRMSHHCDVIGDDQGNSSERIADHKWGKP